MKMPEPLEAAVRKISRKTPIGSLLSSEEWREVPQELRESAQFSAKVESARVLSAIQERTASEIGQLREMLDSGKTAGFDRSSFIDSIREIARGEGLGVTAEGISGSIEDITSIPRLGLIYDMQVGRAFEYARFKTDMAEGALALYPAQEFKRIESRKIPRENWPQRFAQAARDAGDEDALRVLHSSGRMIALKTSGVWEKLSAFGTPWPPFDWGSGMGLEDVDHETAVDLKLIAQDEVPTPIDAGFNDSLEASVAGIEPDVMQKLKASFGEQIETVGDKIRWRPPGGKAPPPPPPLPPPSTPPPVPKTPPIIPPQPTIEVIGGTAKERLTILEFAKDARVGPDVSIVLENRAKWFWIGKDRYKYAMGYAKSKGPGTKAEIRIYPSMRKRTVDPKAVRGGLAHEYGHHQFQNVVTEYRKQLSAASADDALYPSGLLKPGFEKKYPVVAEISPHWETNFATLESDDGVTEYSKTWWKKWHAGETQGWNGPDMGGIQIPMNESYAEVRKLKYAYRYRYADDVSSAWKQFADAVERASESLP